MGKWPITPDWVKDWTEKLPWHSKDDKRFAKYAARLAKLGVAYEPPKKDRMWRYRKLESIKGVVFHQSAGNAYKDPKNTNQYHIGPNHISSKGCPHICYHIYIGKSGNVFLCNPLHAMTWSQNDKKQPGSENRMFISVVVSGRFKTKANRNYDVPTVAQMEACETVWGWLREAFSLTQADIFCHSDFGKIHCPGETLEDWIWKVRSDSGLLVLADTADWQSALANLDYKVGPVDGIWGHKTKRALVEFQRDYQLQPTGIFDRPTAWMIRQANESQICFLDFESAALVL